MADFGVIVLSYAWIIGVADGIIIAAIITAHMVHISTASLALHADVIGIANTDRLYAMSAIAGISSIADMSPIFERSRKRYAQHAAVTTRSTAAVGVRLELARRVSVAVTVNPRN